MPETVRDPATGEEWVRGRGGALHRPCPPDCSGGYRPVNELYAVGLADPETEPRKYAAALNTVYPCSTCNAEVARLWQEGHMRPEHLSAGGCTECRPKPTKAKR